MMMPQMGPKTLPKVVNVVRCVNQYDLSPSTIESANSAKLAVKLMPSKIPFSTKADAKMTSGTTVIVVSSPVVV